MQPLSFGALTSPHDYRTPPVSAVAAMPTVVPDSYFVDVMGLPIWNQKAIGSCVGHGGAKNKQAQDYKETHNVGNHSPRFLYAICKAWDGYPGEGTWPHLVMKALKEYGCATEKTVPNNSDLPHEEYVYQRNINNIPKEAFVEAEPFKIEGYAYVEYWDELKFKQAIMKCAGVILTVQVGQEWWTDANGFGSWAAKDILPLRAIKTVTGQHLIYVYGWDTVAGRTRYHFINSWSEAWADMGKGNFFYDTYRPHMVEAYGSVDLPNDWKEHLKELPKPQEFKHYFGRQISQGETSEEVKALQIALKIDGVFPAGQIATGYYGSITRKAVRDFCAKYAVANWLELRVVDGRYVGPKTRAKLNQLFNK